MGPREGSLKIIEKGTGRLEENNLCKGPEGKRTWESDDGGRPSMAGGIFPYGQGDTNPPQAAF